MRMNEALLRELTVWGPLANKQDNRQLSWHEVKAETFLYLRMRVEEQGGEAMEREWPPSEGVLDLLVQLRQDFCARFPPPGQQQAAPAEHSGPEGIKAA